MSSTSNPAVDVNNLAVQSEEMPSLAEYGREPSTGAWPDGWYAATILAGYATQSGKQMATEDGLSKDGNSRNLFICFAVKNKAGESRNIRANFNYRLPDFSPDRIQTIVRLRKQATEEGWANKWPGELADLQRSNLAISQLGQFERALQFRMKRIPGGGLNASIFVSHQIDIRLKLNAESGFSDVVEYAKLGERKTLYK